MTTSSQPNRRQTSKRYRRPDGVPPEVPPFVLRYERKWSALSAFFALAGVVLLITGTVPLLASVFVLSGVVGLWFFTRPIYVWPTLGPGRAFFILDEEAAVALELYKQRYGCR